jgi:hypothetical protein
MSHIFLNVPSLICVEGYNADRIVILARKEILDNGFQVGGLVIGFAPGAA